MISDLLTENLEAIAYGLEPPHCEVWEADEFTILWLTIHTDAQRMGALRRERADRAVRQMSTPDLLNVLDTILKGESNG